MHQFGIKPKLHRRMPRIRHRINIRGGNDCHNILPIRGKVQMQLAAHQLSPSAICTGRTPAVTLRLSTPAAASFALCSAVSVTVSPMTVSV